MPKIEVDNEVMKALENIAIAERLVFASPQRSSEKNPGVRPLGYYIYHTNGFEPYSCRTS